MSQYSSIIFLSSCMKYKVKRTTPRNRTVGQRKGERWGCTDTQDLKTRFNYLPLPPICGNIQFRCGKRFHKYATIFIFKTQICDRLNFPIFVETLGMFKGVRMFPRGNFLEDFSQK